MASLEKPIVLIGLMGAGKTTIGHKLADKLGLPFTDSDDEVERAAGCSIQDIFELYGEDAFRDVEARVIHRLLNEPPAIIATGGGAFMNTDIRSEILEKAISVWLKAELDVLVLRTAGRSARPLLNQGDPKETLKRLMDIRYPIYAEANITIETGHEAANAAVDAVYAELDAQGGLPSDSAT